MAYLEIPELTVTQKQQMKALIDGYFAHKNIFKYHSTNRRESYAYTVSYTHLDVYKRQR